MKVFHVVTYAGTDGAYGGPLSVAMAQVEELRARGLEATVLSCAEEGRALKQEHLISFPVVKPYPGAGFPVMISPDMMRFLRKNVSPGDVVHVHAAREFIPVAAVLGLPKNDHLVVLQTHGNYVRNDRRKARVYDAILTRRLYNRADKVLVLQTREQRRQAELVASMGVSHAKNFIEVLPNGVPTQECRATPPKSSAEFNYLFLGRLHRIKDPQLFVKSAIKHLESGRQGRFSLVGPDGGELDAVNQLISEAGMTGRIVVEGPLPRPKILDRLLDSHMLVLPSFQDTFPMSVLEAMSVGVPTIVSECMGFSDVIHAKGSGLVVDRSPEKIAAAMSQAQELGIWQKMSDCSVRLIEKQYSITSVVDRLIDIYSS